MMYLEAVLLSAINCNNMKFRYRRQLLHQERAEHTDSQRKYSVVLHEIIITGYEEGRRRRRMRGGGVGGGGGGGEGGGGDEEQGG